MRLLLLTAVVMVAFAANSVLNRAALVEGDSGAMAFAALRIASGAAILALLAAWRAEPGWLRRMHPVESGSLALYVLGFSAAYVSLDAGAGALILFAGVQVTMFAGGIVGGEAIPPRRWAGAGLALVGLAWMLVPGSGGVTWGHGALMAAAALGWGVFSLRGRGGGDPLGRTAAAFVGAVPLGAVAWIAARGALDARGAALAVASGAITSGLGYALWYTVLPSLGASRAALAQLSVPVIAIAMGLALLEESLSARLAFSCLLVVAGVSLGLAPKRR